MTQYPIQPIIICGGSGTRLWPLSRAGFPKQFLSLLSDESLFQQAVLRLQNIQGTQAPIVVGGEPHRFLMREQLHEIEATNAQILLEPEGRNTAPALTLAALEAVKNGDDPILIVTPADHLIPDTVAFTHYLQQAIEHAHKSALVVLGITPTSPDTGYGYIRTDSQMDVQQFVEKPDFETASAYVKDGNYFWNSGMFVMKSSVWLEAIKRKQSSIYHSVLKSWQAGGTDEFFFRPEKKLFLATPKDSIDYAVIENYPQSGKPMKMVPLELDWNDLGSWDAVQQAAEKDAGGNAVIGDGLTRECSNVLIHAASRHVSAVGVNNISIIETSDAVLVIDSAKAQEVRQVVAKLQEDGREEPTLHRKVHRPWGWYDSIDGGDGFKVKRIMVKPGAKLSLQRHQKRAEHWVVVSGVAEVTCGEKTFQLQKNQSTYIPMHEIHRLANPGETPLEIIEVQSGEYLGEDDIERLEDNYGRENE